MLAPPYTEDLIEPGNTQEGGNSSFKVRPVGERMAGLGGWQGLAWGCCGSSW